MTNFTVEIESDSDDCIIEVKTYDDLRTGLGSYKDAENLTNHHSPITAAKVEGLSSGKEGQKTCWLLAEIHAHHLGKGESTSRNPTLRATIRSRVKSDDDCGHIVARSLGGKMVDFNLFPQNRVINRGWQGLKHHWREGVEGVIKKWLTNPSRINPSVHFEVRFYYTDKQYPDRPYNGKLLLIFKCDDGNENKNVNSGKAGIPMELYETLKVDLMNSIDDQVGYGSSTSFVAGTDAHASEFQKLSTEEFRQFVVLLLNNYKTGEQQPTAASSTYSIGQPLLKSK